MNLQLHQLKQIIQYLIYLSNQLSLFQGFFPTYEISQEQIYPLLLLTEISDQKLGRILGIGIADLVNILNIELFVLGGGVANAWDYFIPSTIDEVRKRAPY